MRPCRLNANIRSLETGTTHTAQWALPLATAFPQPTQEFSGRGAGAGTDIDLPFASRLLFCVSRVAIGTSGFFIVDQKARATHSAIGATARPHVGAVSESCVASEHTTRQSPSRCRKPRPRRKGRERSHVSR